MAIILRISPLMIKAFYFIRKLIFSHLVVETVGACIKYFVEIAKNSQTKNLMEVLHMEKRCDRFLDTMIKVASLAVFIVGLLFFNDASVATALR